MSFRKKLKEKLVQLIKKYLVNNNFDCHVSDTLISQITIDYTPQLDLGHYASNIAMLLAKPLKKNPREIATSLKIFFLDDSFFESSIQKIDIAGPGFLNFFVQINIFNFFFEKTFSLEKWIHASFYKNEENAQKKIHFEFISANPTGPLNIVSARSAAVGDSICRVLKRTRKEVFKEYYVNDFGNQVHLLGVSFAVRYLESKGISIEIPQNGYHGEYVSDIVQKILDQNTLPIFFENIESLKGASKEQVDQWLDQAALFFTPLAIQWMLELHQTDLKDFRVEFDHFFSEKSLHENKEVEQAFELLLQRGYVYKKNGASFFKSTDFDDDKDRVLKKKDGVSTYFLADIAYHLNKFSRGYDKIYDIWGPDHHGYIARLTGAMQAIHGKSNKVKKKFDILIVQQVNLVEGGKIVVMSKRLGKFHSMRDLIEKIPVDVIRYFFTSRSQSQHLNFDLELALDQSHKNPVYYIQYAHARIYSIFREYKKKIEKINDKNNGKNTTQENSYQAIISLDFLDQEAWEIPTLKKYLLKPERENLVFELLKFTDEIGMISENMEIHKLTVYLYNLAHSFTKFYHHPENRIIELFKKHDRNHSKEGATLLRLCQITAMILREGLSLLGISAPKKM